MRSWIARILTKPQFSREILILRGWYFGGYVISGWMVRALYTANWPLVCVLIFVSSLYGRMESSRYEWETDARIRALSPNSGTRDLLAVAHKRSDDLRESLFEREQRKLVLLLALRLDEVQGRYEFERERNQRVQGQLDEIEGRLTSLMGGGSGRGPMIR